jgi:hypothetical protein
MTEALSQTGRSDLISNARLWLNLFLDKVYQCQDWNWLKTDSGIVSLVQGGSTPSGYLKLASANLIYQGYVQREIVAFNGDGEYQAYRRMGTVSGQPQKVYIDTQAGTFNFWPPPDYNYSWQHYSFIAPQLPDPTDASQDTNIPLWPLQADALIKAVQLKCLYYQDETRYAAEEKALIDEIVAGKINRMDTQGGNNTLKLGKKFRRRW